MIFKSLTIFYFSLFFLSCKPISRKANLFEEVQECDDSFFLKFKTKYGKDSELSFKDFSAEFVLNGKLKRKYKIKILNDSTSVLSCFKNSRWNVIDSNFNHYFYELGENPNPVGTFEIITYHLSSNYGVSFDAEYSLKNQIASPIKKNEKDNTRLNEYGYGGIERSYIVEDGHWKLVFEKPIVQKK